MNKSKRRNNYKNRIKHATTKTKKNKKGTHQDKNENNSKRNKNIILLKIILMKIVHMMDCLLKHMMKN